MLSTKFVEYIFVEWPTFCPPKNMRFFSFFNDKRSHEKAYDSNQSEHPHLAITYPVRPLR